jgi:hypothetical protein
MNTALIYLAGLVFTLFAFFLIIFKDASRAYAISTKKA